MCLNDSPFDGEPLSIDSTEDHHIPGDLSHLTTYHTPKYRRLFCTTCSAHMFMVSDEATKDGKSAWTAMWGVDTTDGIWTISRHIYVGDTLDGGLADHFRTLQGKGLPRFEGSSAESSSRNELPIGWKAVKGRVNPETLPLYCNCGGVKLYLTRAQNVNPDEYWLVPGKEPGEPIQFLAEHCLCTSCRRCSGNQIQTWIYVPNENIFDALTNAPIDLDNLDKRPKALKQYVSSEGVRRESCGTCGAAVFWSREMKDGERPHMSVAAGLIDQDATGGARAEAWIAWDPKLTYGEDNGNRLARRAFRVSGERETEMTHEVEQIVLHKMPRASLRGELRAAYIGKVRVKLHLN
ncbi:hypothetical protein D9611_004397 [Ephemerocybe angulata]|uniref:CENP-V/GFA domain-containing protein n=1 Tax=Ephemerocybe angulata TaxID=980116 RepID=A0A8H5BKD0_9AGAR|nr:hypothetical protein D9611_004397 [Tulosesus angulatus]